MDAVLYSWTKKIGACRIYVVVIEEYWILHYSLTLVEGLGLGERFRLTCCLESASPCESVPTDIKEFAAKDNWRQLPPYFRDGARARAWTLYYIVEQEDRGLQNICGSYRRVLNPSLKSTLVEGLGLGERFRLTCCLESASPCESVPTDIKEFAAKDNWRQLPPYFRDGTEPRMDSVLYSWTRRWGPAEYTW